MLSTGLNLHQAPKEGWVRNGLQLPFIMLHVCIDTMVVLHRILSSSRVTSTRYVLFKGTMKQLTWHVVTHFCFMLT